MGVVAHEDSFEDQLLDLGHRLMEEYADLPILTVVGALNEARRTTVEWLLRLDVCAVYDLAVWLLNEQRLPAHSSAAEAFGS
jgi:hypothetical protein